MKMYIDKWGEPYIHVVHETIDAYMIDEASSAVTYICYFDTPQRIVRKITKAGNVTKIEYAWGAWDDRATLDYVPINEQLEIEVPEEG